MLPHFRLTISMLLGSLVFTPVGHADSCTVETVKSIFKATDEDLVRIIAGGRNNDALSKVLKEGYREINRANIEISMLEGLQSLLCYAQEFAEVQAKIKNASNDLSEFIYRLYKRAGISVKIENRNGKQVVELTFKDFSNRTKFEETLKKIGMSMDPKKIHGRNDFHLTVQFIPAMNRGSAAGIWVNDVWTVATPPTPENIMALLPNDPDLRTTLFHEVGHGFFSKRQYRKSPTCALDYEFKPHAQVLGYYGKRMPAEEVYMHLNDEYWAWMSI